MRASEGTLNDGPKGQGHRRSTSDEAPEITLAPAAGLRPYQEAGSRRSVPRRDSTAVGTATRPSGPNSAIGHGGDLSGTDSRRLQDQHDFRRERYAHVQEHRTGLREPGGRGR